MRKIMKKNILCKIFGHKLKLAQNSEEMWLLCERCRHDEDVPKEREEEAYQKLSVYKGDLSWK